MNRKSEFLSSGVICFRRKIISNRILVKQWNVESRISVIKCNLKSHDWGAFDCVIGRFCLVTPNILRGMNVGKPTGHFDGWFQMLVD